jgi:hypothetical protein
MADVQESSTTNPRANPGELRPITLHRHGSEKSYDLGPTATELLNAFERTISDKKSRVLSVWPQAVHEISLVHALAALRRLSKCDTQRLTTIFFPWRRTSGATQKALLVDREPLVSAALLPLDRIYSQRPPHASFGYLLALHSLKHLATGQPGNRRYKAVERDPSLLFPSLFEIMPQMGIVASDGVSENSHFLRRLRNNTWIGECDDHLASASAPSTTPFYLFGIHAEHSSVELLRRAALQIASTGRAPDVVLIDAGRRARYVLGERWREVLLQFGQTLAEAFGEACPPALAITDDVFALQTIRWKILNEYDVLRGALSSAKLPSQASLILNVRTDILDAAPVVPAWVEDLSVETYGSDLLDLVENGLKLRKSLIQAGESDLASAVGSAITAIQNLAGIPGPVSPFRDFLVDNRDAYEVRRLGERYDHLAPRGKIATAIKLGSAGASHSQLSKFLDTYSGLCVAVAANNPGTRFFDNCLKQLSATLSKSIVVFSTDLVRDFAEWRIHNDVALAPVRDAIGRSIRFTRARDLHEELEHARQTIAPFEEIIFIEPHADDFLKVLAETGLPSRIKVSCHLARLQQILDRARALLQIEGVNPIEWNLLRVEECCKKAMAGHATDIPDLDVLLHEPRISTIDLTGPRTASSGPTRMIRTSGHVRIRAFDGTELAVYDPDALPVFSRRLAKDLKPGDQICAFSPEFIDDAREKLRLSATAPEVLALYHRAIAEAAANLPGHTLDEKAETLRRLIVRIEPTIELPQSIRQWIDVVDLLDAPRDQVRPQAPRSREHYFAFMKALGISDDVAKNYWDFAIFWTRSKRISTGSAFHQVFLGLLIDPDGTISRFPQADQQDIWRIHETAEEHLVSVLSNDAEGRVE